jgi:hypothetical protein
VYNSSRVVCERPLLERGLDPVGDELDAAYREVVVAVALRPLDATSPGASRSARTLIENMETWASTSEAALAFSLAVKCRRRAFFDLSGRQQNVRGGRSSMAGSRV